jgi:hypothetical protein
VLAEPGVTNTSSKADFDFLWREVETGHAHLATNIQPAKAVSAPKLQQGTHQQQGSRKCLIPSPGLRQSAALPPCMPLLKVVTVFVWLHRELHQQPR